MTLSPSTLWDAVRAQLAVNSSAPRSAIIDAATEALCKRHRLKSDADREDISGRLAKLWAENMSITEPN